MICKILGKLQHLLLIGRHGTHRIEDLGCDGALRRGRTGLLGVWMGHRL